MINDKEWVINPKVAKAKDGSGNENNVVAVPDRQSGGFLPSSMQLGGSGPTAGSVRPPGQQRTLEDIRYARMILNRVHYECNRRDAEIFMH